MDSHRKWRRASVAGVGLGGLLATAAQSAVVRFDSISTTGTLTGSTSGSVIGDTAQLTGTGTLDTFEYSIYNSGAGTLTAATATFHFYQDTQIGNRIGTELGSFTSSLTFTATPGQYVIGNVANLSTLPSPIVFNTSSLVVTEQITSATGSSAGVIFNPIVGVGTDLTPTSHYVDGSFVANANNATTTQMFQIGLVPEPATVSVLTVGAGMLALKRRRRGSTDAG